MALLVADVGKEDDREYPGKILYEMLRSIQLYLSVQFKQEITLVDKKDSMARNLETVSSVASSDLANTSKTSFV